MKRLLTLVTVLTASVLLSGCSRCSQTPPPEPPPVMDPSMPPPGMEVPASDTVPAEPGAETPPATETE
ncbi:MAG TPA: hypothetical protein PKC28_04115 [Bdellovibrionales bacterium]|nr:hypothetical protein [Bdellovibrionales bacterium]